jgi:outer membrane protein TolC
VAPEPAWIEAALDNRPEICSRVWELRALGDDLNAAAFAPLAGGELGAHSEHDPEWRIGPTWTIPLPIFDWGQASQAKIEAQRIAARHDLLEQQREIIQDVRSAYAAYLHARESLSDLENQLLPLQQRQIELARVAYQAGETDLTTLLQGETDMQLTLSKNIELREKLLVAQLKLQRAAGGAGVADRIAAAASTQRSGTPATYPTSRPATGQTP